MSSRSARAQVRAEVLKLKRQDGSYSPADLVDWAEDHPKSALHSQFEWNDEKAGREYRLLQARRIIVTITVEVTNDTPEFISVPSLRRGEDPSSYVPTKVVAGNEAYRKDVLEEIKMKLISMRDRFRPVTPELEPVWKAVSKTCS